MYFKISSKKKNPGTEASVWELALQRHYSMRLLFQELVSLWVSSFLSTDRLVFSMYAYNCCQIPEYFFNFVACHSFVTSFWISIQISEWGKMIDSTCNYYL